MKKALFAVITTTLFSSVVNANSGLADRINEARSFPEESVAIKDTRALCFQHKVRHEDMRHLETSERPHE